MASKRWKGGAAAVAQVVTLTVAGVAATNQVYTVTIGFRSLSYIASGTDTNNTIAAALQGILAGSNYGEFLELTWTVSNNVITGTANTAGMPFIVTTAATGTGALTVATVTANSGPNDVAVAANYDAGVLPGANDDFYADHTSVDMWWNLQVLNGVNLNSATISSTFQAGTGGNGTIGLPEINTLGSQPYLEYRQRALQWSPTTCTIGNGNGSGAGFLNLDFGAGQVALIVHSTGSPLYADVEALCVKGSNVNNIASVNSGSVAFAALSEETMTLSVLNIGSSSNGAPTVRTGKGCTVTTLNMSDGTVLMENAAGTTINKTGGALTVLEGNVTAWNERGGGSAYLGTGTISSIVARAVIDFSQDPRGRNVTNAAFYAGGGFADPLRTVTFANPFVITCGLADVTMDWGQNVEVVLTKL